MDERDGWLTKTHAKVAKQTKPTYINCDELGLGSR
jgi:hypothetical protein